MGLDEAIGLDLDRADDPPADGRNQRRDAWRGQRLVGPLSVICVLGPALPRDERDEPIEVGWSERFNRGLGHASGGGIAFHRIRDTGVEIGDRAHLGAQPPSRRFRRPE